MKFRILCCSDKHIHCSSLRMYACYGLKNSYKYLIFLFAFVFLILPDGFAQTELSPGDIVFTGFQSENPDKFSFLLLKDISDSTQISFTDKGWLESGTFRSNEGIIEWTSSEESLTKGTLITIKDDSAWIASSGSITDISGSFNLAQTGDQIIAFTGTTASSNVIAAIHFNGDDWDADATSSNASAIPAGLVNLETCVAIPHKDNGIYAGPTSGTVNFLQYAVNNPANWKTSNSIIQEWPDFTITSETIIGNDNDLTEFADTVTVKKLIVADSESVIVNPDGRIRSDTINIKSNSNSTGSLIVHGTLENSEAVLVERTIPDKDWHLISSSVSGQSLAGFASTNDLEYYSQDGSGITDYDLAPYSESDNLWKPYTLPTADQGNFIQGRGYEMRLRESSNVDKVIFQGTGIFAGTFTMQLAKTLDGWNCIGNPYTSAIDPVGFINRNGSSELDVLDANYQAVYVWDEVTTNDYIPYTTATADKIPVGMGFFVKAKTDNISVELNSTMQKNSPDAPFKSGEMEIPSIHLVVQKEEMINVTRLIFRSDMSNGLDPGYDIGKFKGNPKLALYTSLLENNGVDFHIQALPDNNFENYRIPVGLDLPEGGEIIFTAESFNMPLGTQVVLEDAETNTFTRLDLPELAYTTTVAANTMGTGRFYLRTDGNDITNNKDFGESDFKVFARDRTIYISGPANAKTQFALYSVDGKLWYKKNAVSINQNKIEGYSFPFGIYLLQIIHNGKTYPFKIVLQ